MKRSAFAGENELEASFLTQGHSATEWPPTA